MGKIEQHLRQRNLDTSLYSGILVDEEEGVASFLTYNLCGQITGYQQYRPHAPKTAVSDPRSCRYFTYSTKGQYPVWGLQYLPLSIKIGELGKRESRILFVAEGIFDISPFHTFGCKGIAVLTNNPKHLKNFLYCLPYVTVGLCDGDKSGKLLSGLVDIPIFLPEGKDSGDMELDWHREIIRNL